MAEAYVGEIRLFPFSFAPRGWFVCAGQLLNIAQYVALFSLLGTRFGGNGTTNFALPDLRARVAMGPDTVDDIGVPLGTEGVTLTTSTTPPHNHTLTFATLAAAERTNVPGGNYLTAPAYHPPGTAAPSPALAYAPPATPVVQMAVMTIGVYGGSVAHENRQPLLGMGYFICSEGTFPTRN